MRQEFPGSYRKSAAQLEEITKTAIVSFDANVLLNVYRYGPKTRSQLLRIMDGLKQRNQLWITHQAVEEFHSSREDVISSQRRTLKELPDCLKPAVAALKSAKILDDFPELRSKIIGLLEESAKELQTTIELTMAELDVADDPIIDQLTDIVDGCYGADPSDREDRIKVAAYRYDRKIPPGYKDAGKPENRFGDYLLWSELLDYAKEHQKPVFLVTDDRKEDWWLIQASYTVGPRRELIDEMSRHSQQQFHVYNPEMFFSVISGYLAIDIDDSTIDEARRVGEELDSAVARFAHPDELQHRNDLQTVSYSPVEYPLLRGVVADALNGTSIGPLAGIADASLLKRLADTFTANSSIAAMEFQNQALLRSASGGLDIESVLRLAREQFLGTADASVPNIIARQMGIYGGAPIPAQPYGTPTPSDADESSLPEEQGIEEPAE